MDMQLTPFLDSTGLTPESRCILLLHQLRRQRNQFHGTAQRTMSSILERLRKSIEAPALEMLLRFLSHSVFTCPLHEDLCMKFPFGLSAGKKICFFWETILFLLLGYWGQPNKCCFLFTSVLQETHNPILTCGTGQLAQLFFYLLALTFFSN